MLASGNDQLAVVGAAKEEEIPLQSEHQSEFELPLTPPDVSFDVRHAILEDLVSARLAEVRRVGKETRRIESALQQHRENVKDLLGTKYEQFRAYVADKKRDQAALLFPPRGPEMSTADIDHLRRDRREESQHYLKELGIDQNELRRLSRETIARLEELRPPRPVRDGKPVMIISESDVPSEILEHKTNPWTVVGPPYGWSWWYDGSNDGFSFTPTLHLDAGTGFVGNDNYVEDSDAGDADYAYMQYSTAVSFWYRMPTAGLVEVWIEAVSNWGHHRVALWDEFGWSDSMVNQHDYLTLNASVGGSASELQRAEMSWFHEDGNTDGYWDNHYLTDGAPYWANLISDPNIIIPAGSLVLVEVGALNWNSAFANDVSVHSSLDFAWTINHVQVHSTGG